MAQVVAQAAGATDEDAAWRAKLDTNFARNKQWAKPDPGGYQTPLDPRQEADFRTWLQSNKVPFNPNDPRTDYDMRGYWKDVAAGGATQTAVNPNDHQLHFPDTYKTPYHKSFSAESRYAQPNAPAWINDHQLADPRTGQVLFDERAAGEEGPEQ